MTKSKVYNSIKSIIVLVARMSTVFLCCYELACAIVDARYLRDIVVFFLAGFIMIVSALCSDSDAYLIDGRETYVCYGILASIMFINSEIILLPCYLAVSFFVLWKSKGDMRLGVTMSYIVGLEASSVVSLIYPGSFFYPGGYDDFNKMFLQSIALDIIFIIVAFAYYCRDKIEESLAKAVCRDVMFVNLVLFATTTLVLYVNKSGLLYGLQNYSSDMYNCVGVMYKLAGITGRKNLLMYLSLLAVIVLAVCTVFVIVFKTIPKKIRQRISVALTGVVLFGMSYATKFGTDILSADKAEKYEISFDELLYAEMYTYMLEVSEDGDSYITQGEDPMFHVLFDQFGIQNIPFCVNVEIGKLDNKGEVFQLFGLESYKDVCSTMKKGDNFFLLDWLEQNDIGLRFDIGTSGDKVVKIERIVFNDIEPMIREYTEKIKTGSYYVVILGILYFIYDFILNRRKEIEE